MKRTTAVIIKVTLPAKENKIQILLTTCSKWQQPMAVANELS